MTRTREFAESGEDTEASRYASEIVFEAAREPVPVQEAAKEVIIFEWPAATFRNPHEFNAEYIHIPGGRFEYSVTKKSEPAADLYFAKYPVTNRRYRRFISYLASKENELSKILPVDLFSQRMFEFATKTKDFREYLTEDHHGWADKLRSEYDDEKRFRGDDQPVVGVSWFDAQAYCFWLTALAKAGAKGSADDVSLVFRLPTEVEWEWAAAGREPGGGLREFPWPVEKGGPNEKLANYGANVGATTPVGRYPEGATPEGLMDMAGNVWEWIENWHEEYKDIARSLRGGSWDDIGFNLRCSYRNRNVPDNRNGLFGFRVVLSQS